MTTAFQSGPGFYAADTNQVDPSLAPGAIRIYCVRLEAYDISGSPEDPGNDISFELIFAKAEQDPRLAKALLKLGHAIDGNRALLKDLARRG